MEHSLLVSDGANFGIFLEESLCIAEEEARIRFDVLIALDSLDVSSSLMLSLILKCCLIYS